MVNNSDLAALIAAKAREGQLFPFYIIQAHPHSPEGEVQRWMSALMKSLLIQEGRQDQDRDPDVLVLSSDKGKSYEIAQLTPLMRQLSYESFTQKRRYLIIEQAHQCTPRLYNKLLKTLESPPENTTIFLLDSLAAPILATVKSRAVTLRLGPGDSVSSPPPPKGMSFARFVEKQDPALGKLWQGTASLHEMAQKVQALGHQETFLPLALRWWSAQVDEFGQCCDFVETLKLLERHKALHGRKQTQLAIILESLRQCSAS